MLAPILEDARAMEYQGRYKVQLEIPSSSTLSSSDIDRLASLASWETDPNDNVTDYEGGRSVLVPRSIPIVRKGIELTMVQISGIGYKRLDFIQSSSPNAPVGFYSDDLFLPPSNSNFMDSLRGTSLMTTSFSVNGVEQKVRPGYRAFGTYLFPELRTKIIFTNEASQFDLEHLVTPQVEAYGRYMDDGLKDADGEYGFIAFSVPDAERASQELNKKLTELVSLGANLQQTVYGFWLVSQGLILPLISGLRELHDKKRVAHLQTHMSNYYNVHGLTYLMDWSTMRRLGSNPFDNIFNRTVDVKRPRENFQQLLTSTLGSFISNDVIEQVSSLVMESSLEVYSGDVSREVKILDLINRGMTIYGPNGREIDLVIQWMKDTGLEGFPRHEYSESTKQPSQQLSHEEIINRLKRQGIPNMSDDSRKQKVGRNSACPCGSGKKYKNCCIRK